MGDRGFCSFLAKSQKVRPRSIFLGVSLFFPFFPWSLFFFCLSSRLVFLSFQFVPSTDGEFCARFPISARWHTKYNCNVELDPCISIKHLPGNGIKSQFGTWLWLEKQKPEMQPIRVPVQQQSPKNERRADKALLHATDLRRPGSGHGAPPERGGLRYCIFRFGYLVVLYRTVPCSASARKPAATAVAATALPGRVACIYRLHEHEHEHEQQPANELGSDSLRLHLPVNQSHSTLSTGCEVLFANP